MSFLAASAFLKALGWALLNSVWQFAICWLLYRIFTGPSSRISAAIKHTAGLCILFTGTLFFIVEFSWKYYAGAPVTATGSHFFVVENTAWYNSWQTAGNYLDGFMPYWSVIYLLCVAVLFLKMGFFVKHAGSLQANGVTKMSVSWRMYVKNIAAQLGIHKNVQALLSVHVDTPQVIGFLKPVILIPAACLTQLSTVQLEAVLLHELVHIKRNDYLVNMLMAGIEIFFFFNPFVKQITAAIRKEREYSCDDMVIQFQYQPDNYAAALLTLERSRLIPVTYGIAASGKNQKQLLTRIERIIGIKNKPGNLYKASAALFILLLLGFIASIHPSPAGTDLFDSGPVSFAGSSVMGAPFSTENTHTLTKPSIILAVTNSQIKKVCIEAPALPDPAKQYTHTGNNIYSVAASNTFQVQDDAIENVAIATADKEAVDYSLAQNGPIDVPVTEDPLVASEEPYVPASSFSFKVIEDTARPKIKGETYSERMARESMVKAQRAIALVDWKKIEKDFKSQPKALAKLKKELTIQLQSLNWQKINADTQEEIQRQQAEKLQEAFRQNEVIKQYQQKEVYLEAIQKQLTEQEQLIKVSGQKLDDSQKELQERRKKLQLEMKKKRIIYI